MERIARIIGTLLIAACLYLPLRSLTGTLPIPPTLQTLDAIAAAVLIMQLAHNYMQHRRKKPKP